MFEERTKRKLEKHRIEALSSIGADRLFVELMAQRPRRADDIIDSQLLEKVLKALTTIEERAKSEVDVEDLVSLTEDAELQGIFAAYFCPAPEIKDEGSRVFDQIEGWGIPTGAIERLRELLIQKLDSSDSHEARSALYALFAERDSWSDYTEEYEDRMQRYTRVLFWTTMLLLIVAIFALHFSFLFSPLLLLGLLFAGAAGSGVSVMAKMPALDVSLAGELDAYGRRVLSRIGVGVVASLIGCGLLAWGIFPISIQNQTFADALNSCTASVSGTAIKSLIILGIAMLFGFSERALTSFEKQIFGELNSAMKR